MNTARSEGSDVTRDSASSSPSTARSSIFLLSERRDLAAARRFFARALRAGTVPAEVTTDRAPAYMGGCSMSWSPRPCTRWSGTPITRSRRITGGSRPGCGRCAASNATAQHGSSPPARAFAQNLRRGHYDIATDTPDLCKLRTIFGELALAI